MSETMETMDDYKDMLDASFREISEGDLVDCTVVGISDTDVTVDLQYNTAGIIRLEELSADPSFSIKADMQIGDKFKAEVLRMDDGRGNLLLSKKKADAALSWEKFGAMKDEGTVVDMKISEAVKAGVVGFVDGSRVFVPASKLALSFVEDLTEWVGKTIPVKFITVDKADKKLVASSRDVLRERAQEEKAKLVSNLQVGLITEGTVESLQPYGAFVGLGNGIDGLLHVSQIPAEKRLKHPKDVLSVGDKVKVKVTKIQDGRISLSMRAVEETAPAEEIVEEKVVLPKSEKLTTNLGSLLKGLNLPEE